jgi:hypothetical protein
MDAVSSEDCWSLGATVRPSRYLAPSSKRAALAKSAQWIRIWRAVICALV